MVKHVVELIHGCWAALTADRAQAYQVLLLAVILSVALGLRLWGITFGLPYALHVDERALALPALKIIQTGDYNPHRFDYGSLHIYLLSLVYIGYFLYGARSSIFQTVQDIPVIQDYNIGAYPVPTVFLAGRIVSALLGVATVYWVYRVGKRVGGRRVGLIAASLLAVLPAVVRQSHFIVSDPSMNLLILVAVELIIMAYQSDRTWPVLAAGLLTGLAAASKQTAVQLGASVFLLAIVRPASTMRRWFVVILGLLSVALGFFLGTPYAILDLPTFLNWQAFDLRLYARPGVALYEGPSWLWHLRFLLLSENSVLLLLAFVGALIVTKRQRWLGVILIAFPALHWISMSLQATRYDRTWVPIASFMCLFAAVAIIYIADTLSRRYAKLIGHTALLAVALTLILVVPLTLLSAKVDILFNEKEVRVRTLEWIEQNLPRSSHLALEYSSPPLSAESWHLTRTISLAQHDLKWYQSQGVDYLVVSSSSAQSPNRTVAEEQWYQQVFATCQLLVEIEGPGLGLPDRYFRIYDAKSCSGS